MSSQGRFTYPRIREGSRRGGEYTSNAFQQQHQQFSPPSGGSERSVSTSRSSSGLGASENLFEYKMFPTIKNTTVRFPKFPQTDIIKNEMHKSITLCTGSADELVQTEFPFPSKPIHALPT